MVLVKSYDIKPTKLMPNSPYRLLHYPGLLTKEVKDPAFNPTTIYDIFARNGWFAQWIARYGPTQASHYHSTAHECMAVISGEGATIRFGVADTSNDEQENTYGPAHEDGGIELSASAGDVFILPAGVAHKTYRPKPDAPNLDFKVLPNAHEAEPEEARKFFEGIKVKGDFMMMGAYPRGNKWDFAVGGDHEGRYEQVWNTPKPALDPVLGDSLEGIVGLWKDDQEAPSIKSKI